MEAETPVRKLCSTTRELGVLFRDRCRVRGATSQKIEVEDASDHIILEGPRASTSLVELDVHAIRIQKENAMRA